MYASKQPTDAHKSTDAPQQVHFTADAPKPCQQFCDKWCEDICDRCPDRVLLDPDTLVHVLQVHGEGIVHGNKTWLPIQLCGLSFRFDDHQSLKGSTWCCVQCTGIISVARCTSCHVWTCTSALGHGWITQPSAIASIRCLIGAASVWQKSIC